MVGVLRHEEGVRVDAERLARLCAARSPRDAGEVLHSWLHDIAARIDDIGRHVAADDGAALIRSVRIAVRIAEPMGMASFVAVAQDLVAATRAGDRPAQAAVFARLRRVADRSLTAICDLRDMTV